MSSAPPTAANMGADLKDTAAAAAAKPKPCCVCLDQKAKRDECMLFSTSNDAQKECADLVGQYRQCMAGYGFKI
ncbi:cytochrome C oxidase copper chaperone-domain-containing protein [Phaeosphaeria sp. MPI-PUGE-AT-0046c]|nr:cytochrome C oxidase copper chaperone-domain-containing protein [Phaeosphaeria sp. MPI-PUGE-AT-0046c]